VTSHKDSMMSGIFEITVVRKAELFVLRERDRMRQ
jgi:hypothetical protein